MLATDYAGYYGIAPQGDNETDVAFRSRVSGILRDRGQIIEAHEAYADERYEDSDNVMTGITGAMAQALHGTNYGSYGVRQIDDDFAVGTIVQNPKPEIDPMMAMLMVAMFG
jgi:hypothetical protein